MSISKPSGSRAEKKGNKQVNGKGNLDNVMSSSNISLKTEKVDHNFNIRRGNKPSGVKRIVRHAASNSSIDKRKRVNKQINGKGNVDNAAVSSSGVNLKTKGGHDAVRQRNKPFLVKSAVPDVKSYSSSDKKKRVEVNNGRGSVDKADVSSSSVNLKAKSGRDVVRQKNKPLRLESAVRDVKSYGSIDKKKAVNKQVNGKGNIDNTVSSSNVKTKTKGGLHGHDIVSQPNQPIHRKRFVRDASSDNSSSTKKAISLVAKIGVNKKRSLSAKNDTDMENENLPKKKKKRVIRLDPHDVSNKRLDDHPMHNEPDGGKVKEVLADKSSVKVSKNAQFRAIQPSASILSFVEDNLIGRRREIEFRRAGYNIELNAPLDNIPFSTSLERERIEVPVFRNKLEFFAAAKVSSSFPSPDLPEIAFAGRSNVGKSSLLNSLTRQWGVARTSDKPGLTQTINFFKLGSKLSLVDLPGYGFAYAKEEVKEAWEELVKEYVTSRLGLKRVCLLVDTKWGMKPRDHELIDLMERSQTKYQIVLTKTDLISPIDVARRASQIEENLKAKRSIVQPSMMVSSKTGAGIRSLRTVLAGIARLARH